MRGNGTNLGIMRSDPRPARLLDLSRLVSRAGRKPTGIDRVERAYLDALLASDVPAFGLVRTPLGFLLLDEAGLEGLAARLDGRTPWGEASRLMSVFHSIDEGYQRALSDARRLAKARATRRLLGRMLKRHLPAGSTYVNVGHTNLTDFVTTGVKAIPGATITVMVHDTIPLDFPQYQRPEAPARFRLFLKRVAERADLVIYNSAATKADAERHMEAFGRCPEGLVAHLGVDLPQAQAGALPKGLPPQAPYFVTVGTIEGRKNHAFLLSLWEQMEKQTPPQDMPELIFIGARGWANAEFFFRFDHSRLKSQFIHEVNDLDDEAMAALLDGASGALFPSLAEGYGLPVFEALARGVPVICPELPVYREVAGDIPVYASINDSYLWIRRIMTLAQGSGAGHGKGENGFKPPKWADHFNLVLSRT